MTVTFRMMTILIYLQWLDSSFYERMNGNLVLPIYVVFCAVCGITYITITFIRWSAAPVKTNDHQ